MSTITTHVLDLTRGRPAAGIVVIVERHDDGDRWTELARGSTNADGRIMDLFSASAPLSHGLYRLRFETGSYFASQEVRGLYPEVHILVTVEDPTAHYHVPLILSPYGYSTYRGS
jgi:5-hydroxyisourate hydrolase